MRHSMKYSITPDPIVRSLRSSYINIEQAYYRLHLHPQGVGNKKAKTTIVYPERNTPMPQCLIYIIPVAIVLIVFIAGFAYSHRMVTKNQIAAPTQDRPANSGIYEALGANQQSGHALGAVQSVIRGRGRFLPFGLMLIGVSVLGLWALHFTDILTEYTETPLTKLAATVILAGGIVWGLQMISYITYRVKLRLTGFEISSVFGTKAYEYKDTDFYLGQTI